MVSFTSLRAERIILRLALGIVGIATCAAAATPAWAAGLYPEITRPALAASLGEPADLAIALDGEMFVADRANGRVAVMVDGVVIRDWDGSNGTGPELQSPAGIAIGPDANVYVADAKLDMVLVYQRDGSFVRAIGGGTGSTDGKLFGPSDVVVDAGGAVWVADTFNDRVQKFSSAGVWIKTVGTSGIPTFMQPVSLDLYGGLVYVSEATGLRGQAFNASTYAIAIQPWGITDSSGTYVSRYLRPAGIDVDSSARLFLVDGGRGVVEQLNSTASAVTTLSLGGPAGDLSQPAGVLSTTSHLLVADSANDRIARYGFVASAWDSPLRPTGSTASGKFMAPACLAPLSGGGFVVADTGGDRLQRFDDSGALVAEFGASGPGAVDAPWGVVVSAGEVFVADSGNHRIQVYDESGGFLRTLGAAGAGPGQFSAPSALAVDPGGNLLVADTGNNRVQRLTTAGAHIQTIGAGEVNGPQGVAVNSAGTVFVADTGGHRIRAYSAAGVIQRTWGSFGPGNGQMSYPKGLAVDPVTDEVLLADSGNHRIQAFTATGGFSAVLLGRGTASGELRSPASVAIAPSRGLLVADTGNHRVQRLAYDAVAPTTVATGIPPSWVNTPVTVTLTATDTASGVATTYYRLGSGTDTVYTGPFTVSAQGTTGLRYWSVDKTGNVEAQGIGTIRIDSVPPSGVMSVASGATLVGTRTVSVESTITDAVTMSIDTGSGYGSRLPYSKAATVTLPADGLRTVNVRYYDVLDNVLTLSDQVTVDTAAPAVSLTRAPSSVITSLPVTVTLAATDAVSGVSQRFIRIQPSAEQPYTGPVTLDTEGTHQVTARAVDAIGNAASTATTVTIDRTGPTTTLTGISNGQLFATPAVFSLSAVDAVSGVSSVRYILDSGAEKTFGSPVSVSTEGTHTLSYSSIDGSGNRGPSGSVTFVVDRTAPSVSATGVVDGSYRATDTTVTLAADDTLSGVARIEYRVDGGEPAVYDGPFVVSGEAPHIVEYEAYDRVGNSSGTLLLRFTIDSRVPVGDMTVEQGAEYSNALDLSVENSVYGASEMRFDVGTGFSEWAPYESTFTVSAPGEGTHTIVGEYRSLAGLSTQIPATITVDMSGPDVGTVRFTPTMLKLASTNTLWYLDGTWSATDQGVVPSGIARHSVVLAGRAYTPAEPMVSFAAVPTGTYTARTQAEDVAGNTSTATDTSVRLGYYTPPTLMRRAGTNTVRFTVPGVVLKAGEQAVFRCFKQDRDGTWRLARTAAARPTTTTSGPALTNAVPLTPGMWRISLETRTTSEYRLGRPSAAISIR